MYHWIDSHAHIYMEEFDKDREEMLSRSKNKGLEKIYMPNVDSSSIDAMMEVEHKHPDYCVAMMGLHPCSVKKHFEKDLYQVETWLSKRQFAAVGEVGIDLYWDKTFFEQQKEVLSIQIKWAQRDETPIVIHCRESIDETIALVEEHDNKNMKGVFHCFTGSAEQAEQIVKLGFYIGLGGLSTFKNGEIDKVIPKLKLENILLETDSPYLCPVPHRGKRNEPSYLPLIADKIAELMDVSLKEVSNITSANAKKLFAL